MRLAPSRFSLSGLTPSRFGRQFRHSANLPCRLLLTAAILPALAACGSSGKAGDIEIIRHPAYQWDLNENGAVTHSEYEQYRENIFTTADEDHNGIVDEDEWDDIRDDDETGIRRADFAALDFNGNGYLSFNEVMSLPQSDFHSLDENRDGVISSVELNNASKTRARGGLRRRSPDDGFRRDPNAGL